MICRISTKPSSQTAILFKQSISSVSSSLEQVTLEKSILSGATFKYGFIRLCETLPQWLSLLDSSIGNDFPSVWSQHIHTSRKWCLNSLKLLFDDIIVSGRKKANNDKRLEALCKRLHDYNVIINENKSSFVRLLDFEEHTISSTGVLPLNSNIGGIVNFDAPTFCKKISPYLEAANLYRKFI